MSCYFQAIFGRDCYDPVSRFYGLSLELVSYELVSRAYGLFLECICFSKSVLVHYCRQMRFMLSFYSEGSEDQKIGDHVSYKNDSLIRNLSQTYSIVLVQINIEVPRTSLSLKGVLREGLSWNSEREDTKSNLGSKLIAYVLLRWLQTAFSKFSKLEEIFKP